MAEAQPLTAQSLHLKVELAVWAVRLSGTVWLISGSLIAASSVTMCDLKGLSRSSFHKPPVTAETFAC